MSKSKGKGYNSTEEALELSDRLVAVTTECNSDTNSTEADFKWLLLFVQGK